MSKSPIIYEYSYIKYLRVEFIEPMRIGSFTEFGKGTNKVTNMVKTHCTQLWKSHNKTPCIRQLIFSHKILKHILSKYSIKILNLN